MNKITNITGWHILKVGLYSNEIKVSQLDVKQETLQKFGTVSEQTAKEWRRHVRSKYQSDYGISVTGIAGPDGGTKDKPVGTIWISITTPKETITKLLNLTPNRKMNIHFSFSRIMNMLCKN